MHLWVLHGNKAKHREKKERIWRIWAKPFSDIKWSECKKKKEEKKKKASNRTQWSINMCWFGRVISGSETGFYHLSQTEANKLQWHHLPRSDAEPAVATRGSCALLNDQSKEQLLLRLPGATSWWLLLSLGYSDQSDRTEEALNGSICHIQRRDHSLCLAFSK